MRWGETGDVSLCKGSTKQHALERCVFSYRTKMRGRYHLLSFFEPTGLRDRWKRTEERRRKRSGSVYMHLMHMK